MSFQLSQHRNWLKLFLCVYLIVPFSCENLDCPDSCCGDFEQRYTKIDSLSLSVGSIKISQGSTHLRRDFTLNKSDSFDDAAINIYIVELEWLAMSRNIVEFAFINSAFACSPPEPEPTQLLTSIKIFSDSTVNANDVVYQPGEDLSVLFEVVQRIADYQNFTIEEFIHTHQDYPYEFGPYGTNFTLKLNTHVSLPKQNISIEIEFDDQSVFSLTTDEFIIK